jgi:hypothetical protein
MPGGLALAQQRQRPVDELGQFPGLLVAGLGPLLEIADALAVGRQHQFRLDRLDVGDGSILPSTWVTPVEAAHHAGDSVDLADIGGETLVASPSPADAAHQPGDVDEVSRVGMIWALPAILARTSRRGSEHADVARRGFDGAERIIRRLRRRRLRRRVERRRLADIRQADDATFSPIAYSSFLAGFSGGD